MSFFSASQEAQINASMENLHYEFAARNPFYAVKEGTETIVSENPNHNAFYGSAPLNSETVTTKVSGLFFARAYYLNNDDNFHQINFQNNTQNISTNVAQNILKVVTDSTGKMLLEDADRIEWDGEWFRKKSTPKKHGLLQKNFNTYYFEEVK